MAFETKQMNVSAHSSGKVGHLETVYENRPGTHVMLSPFHLLALRLTLSAHESRWHRVRCAPVGGWAETFPRGSGDRAQQRIGWPFGCGRVDARHLRCRAG